MISGSEILRNDVQVARYVPHLIENVVIGELHLRRIIAYESTTPSALREGAARHNALAGDTLAEITENNGHLCSRLIVINNDCRAKVSCDSCPIQRQNP